MIGDDLLKTDTKIYVAATGAGAGIQNIIWGTPGVSKVFVGACFPYSTAELDSFIGRKPDQYSSKETAFEMAISAYLKACGHGERVMGVGLSASVSSSTPHRGEHRVHVAAVTDWGVFYEPLVIEKAPPEFRALDVRFDDGNFSDSHGINLIGWALDRQGEDHSEYATELIMNRHKPPTWAEIYLPGAFNPPHEGHFWLAMQTGAMFQIEIAPPHKPALTPAEILRRVDGLKGMPVCITKGLALFTDKAKAFPGSSFILGADTMLRMLDPTWGVSRDEIFRVLAETDVTLVVADREVNGRVVTMNDIVGMYNFPIENFKRLQVPKKYLYTSSTKIREGKCQT